MFSLNSSLGFLSTKNQKLKIKTLQVINYSNASKILIKATTVTDLT